MTNVTAYGTGVSYYTMYVNNGNPVRLLMQGINFIMGSHPDVYIFDYHVFRGNISNANFDVPDICLNQNLASTPVLKRRSAYRLVSPPPKKKKNTHKNILLLFLILLFL